MPDFAGRLASLSASCPPPPPVHPLAAPLDLFASVLAGLRAAGVPKEVLLEAVLRAYGLEVETLHLEVVEVQ